MVKEGNPSFQRDVLVEFKDIKTAQRFFSSQQFKEISKFRKAGFKWLFNIIEWRKN